MPPLLPPCSAAPPRPPRIGLSSIFSWAGATAVSLAVPSLSRPLDLFDRPLRAVRPTDSGPRREALPTPLVGGIPARPPGELIPTPVADAEAASGGSLPRSTGGLELLLLVPCDDLV